MSEHLTKIYDLILDRLPEIVPELKPRPVGRRYGLICPECRKAEAYIYRNSHYIKCNRQNNCTLSSKPVTLWDYLQTREGWPQSETLRNLAGLVGYALPELPPEIVERMAQDKAESQARENVFTLFRAWYLFEPGADRVKDYLKNRGWSQGERDEIEDVGYFSNALVEKEFFEGKTEGDRERELLKKLVGHIGDHSTLTIESYSLVMPWRGPSGEIKGFVFRAIDETKPKYLVSPPGAEKALFNVHNARRSRSNSVYIVEGVIDALRLNAGGIPNVIALGGTSLDRGAEILKASGFKHAILILDADDAGAGGTEKTIRTLNKAGLNSSFKALPAGQGKDPDEFLRAGHTIEEFEKLPIISGLTWLARRIMDAGEVEDINKQRDAFDNVIELADDLDNAIDNKELFNTLAEYGIPAEIIEEKRRAITERKTEEKKRAELSTAFKKADNTLEAGGNLKAALKIIEAVKTSISDGERKPVKSFAEYLREKRETEKQRDPLKPLGLPLKKFKNIEFQTDGIQPGLYLIGAGPNVGKTAFSVNLAIDLIKTNPDIAVYFYTLDDTKGIIINRFLGALTSFQINKIQKGFKTSIEDNQKIDEAYGTLASWNQQGRLYVKDIEEIKHIEDIENDVKNEKEAGRRAVIFVDALYNLQVENNTPGGIREMNIDRAIQIKGVVDKFDVPLFCTVEIRKGQKEKAGQAKPAAPTLDDIMETGKFAYNANLVWILHSVADPNAEGNQINVEISCVKNKLNYDKRKRNLTFYPQTSIIEETSGGTL